jgi:hypothetical protein
MRKRYRSKRRSCGLCKPHKRGLQSRWTAKELEAARLAERELRAALPLGSGACLGF